MEKVDVNGIELLRFSRGPSSFLVNPKDGARLMNWYITMADGVVRDVIHWPENAPLGGAEFGNVRGGVPILFPFCGTNFVDGKSGYWKTPDSNEILPMKQHGYAFTGKFEVTFATEFGFTAKFIPDADCKKAYPYDYQFTVTYRFSDLSLSCELLLVNLGNKRIPWAAGLHPYFVLPWHKNASRNNYRIISDAKKACNILPDGSFVKADETKTSFADTQIYNRISTNLKTGIIKFGPKSGEEDITIKIAGGGKPDVGTCFVTWAETDDAPYYCIEPWMDLPNSASTTKHFVEPNSQKSFLVEISLI